MNNVVVRIRLRKLEVWKFRFFYCSVAAEIAWAWINNVFLLLIYSLSLPFIWSLFHSYYNTPHFAWRSYLFSLGALLLTLLNLMVVDLGTHLFLNCTLLVEENNINVLSLSRILISSFSHVSHGVIGKKVFPTLVL